jgi:hypothetical protein
MNLRHHDSGRRCGNGFPFVIAGLDPAIHARSRLVHPGRSNSPHFRMDHRVKPGGDEGMGRAFPAWCGGWVKINPRADQA